MNNRKGLPTGIADGDGKDGNHTLIVDTQIINGLKSVPPGEMNKLAEAVRIYLDYFSPADEEGRTPAQRASLEMPEWLRLIRPEPGEKLSERDIEILREDNLYFSNVVIQRIILDWNENEGLAGVINSIMTEIEKPGTRTKLEEAGRNAAGGHGRKDSRNGKQHSELLRGSSLEDIIIVPFMRVYMIEESSDAWNWLLSYQDRRAIEYFGVLHSVRFEQNEMPEEGVLSATAYCFRLDGSKVKVGTRLGTINFARSRIEVSSVVKSRFRVLTELVEDIFRFHGLELVKELTDYYERRPD